jgi:hypothetical protein
VDRTMADVDQMLMEKGHDPIAAAVGAYSLLRFSTLDRLHHLAGEPPKLVPMDARGSAVRGGHLAREGHHAAALQAFVELREVVCRASAMALAMPSTDWSSARKSVPRSSTQASSPRARPRCEHSGRSRGWPISDTRSWLSPATRPNSRSAARSQLHASRGADG